jgi:regulator of G-protein signaling
LKLNKFILQPLDLDGYSRELAGNEVFIEQRVIFKLDLPNRKVISVKSKPCKLLCEVLRPILHKYNYRLDMVQVFTRENNNNPIDTTLQVTSVDGLRLQILCKSESDNVEVAAATNKPGIHNFNLKNAPVTFVRANKLVSSISNPQLNTLDEITNKVFNEVLQGKNNNEANSACGIGGDFGSVKVAT